MSFKPQFYRHKKSLYTLSRISSGLITGLAFLWIVALASPAMAVGPNALGTEKLDLSKDASYQSGPWTYEHTIGAKGSRSEGYYGKLSFNGNPVPAPAGVNDYYETPWGPMYWVGEPATLFGYHGWMPKPLPRESVGQILAAPATLAGRTFDVQVKLLAAEELATPDRIEKDPKVLDALKPFDLKQAHIQRNWFKLSSEWTTLHDTKRWGHLEVRLAPSEPNRPLALEFRCGGRLSLSTSAQASGLDALSALRFDAASTRFVDLPPQNGAVRAVRCTLSGIVDDDMDLFLVCNVGGGSEAKPALGKVRTLGSKSNKKTVTLKKVDTVVVELPGNLSTGFAWLVSSVEGDAVTQVGQVEYVQRNTRLSAPVGTGGVFRATFQVAKAGQSKIVMAYRRPWESDQPAAESFEVTLKVKGAAAKTKESSGTKSDKR